MQLKICENQEGEIVVLGYKEFSPVQNSASKWVTKDVENVKRITYPNTTNGLSIKQTGKNRGISNSISYLLNDSNAVFSNARWVGLFTMPLAAHYRCVPILPVNFMKCCALFSSRKTIQNTWINQKDEYSEPNTGHPEYQQWNNDTVIYALFHSSSRQTSLRNISYKEHLYQITNEFFFMSKEEIKNLADTISYNELYQDVRFEQFERYVYTLLQTMQLSDDAKHILESARSLVRETMPERSGYNLEHPELQLNSWDAGYLQLKGLWKEAQPEKFEQFRKDYLKFEKRVREGVYKFGFLPPEFVPLSQEPEIKGV